MKITLPLPPTLSRATNNYANRRIKSADAKAWELEAGLILNSVHTKFKGAVEVSYLIYYKTKRAQDLANREKLTSDILTKHGIIEDDSLIYKMTLIRGGVDKNNPRIEITIKEYE